MEWINVQDKQPDTGKFDTVDVWICCGSRTYSASYIKHKYDKVGRFYLDLNYPKMIFEDLTSHVTHWQYVELPCA